MKAEVYPSPDGWRFRIRGGNNEIMAVGEAYVRRIDAEHALQTLFRAGGTVDVTVRSHHREIVDHYTLGGQPTTADEAITAAEQQRETTPDRRISRCPECGQWDGHRVGCVVGCALQLPLEDEELQ